MKGNFLLSLDAALQFFTKIHALESALVLKIQANELRALNKGEIVAEVEITMQTPFLTVSCFATQKSIAKAFVFLSMLEPQPIGLSLSDNGWIIVNEAIL